MTNEPNQEPFSEARLDSPEYRERLMRKLNCLIAVLEVATAKVRKSLTGPEADVERLERIRSNLESTLDVCHRARAALERREALPADLPENLRAVVRESYGAQPTEAPKMLPQRRQRSARPPLETSSEAERAKFERLAPISRAELASVDLDELAKKLA